MKLSADSGLRTPENNVVTVKRDEHPLNLVPSDAPWLPGFLASSLKFLDCSLSWLAVPVSSAIPFSRFHRKRRVAS